MQVKKIIFSILVITSCSKSTSLVWLSDAQWKKEDAFVDCLAGVCKVLGDFDSKPVHSNLKTAAVGDTISVFRTSTSDSEESLLKRYRIKGIALKDGRCWINVKPGESDSYLVVSGCTERKI